MDTTVLWLLTYLLHSTLLLGAAALVRHALGERRLALQEALLRVALVGGFVTATLQLTLGFKPLSGSLAVHSERAAVANASDADATIGALASRAPQRPLDAGDWRGSTLAAPWPAAATRPTGRSTTAAHLKRHWRALLLTLWISLASWAFLRLVVSVWRLWQLLRGRCALREGRVVLGAQAIARALGLRAAVPLCAAPRLRVPVATGVIRPEVCLPTRVLTELIDEQQRALCAHELAHVARRDPAWLLVARVVEALAPVQPLNRWARRRLVDLAECLSDDLAVAASAEPLGLARSLVNVASWSHAVPDVVLATAAGALSSRSRLAYRVERLMDPARNLERPIRGFVPLAAVAVLITALVTPVVSGSSPDEQKAQPEAAPVATVPQPLPESAPAPEAVVKPVPRPHPVVAPRPAPRSMPHEVVLPAPPTPPAPPAAGHGEAREEAEAGEAAERVAHRIEERVRSRKEEMTKLRAHVDALVAGFGPRSEEMERLSKQISETAAEMAKEIAENAASGRAHRDLASARRMADLRHEMVELGQKFRMSPEQIDALQQMAHELAELARPTGEEMEQLMRLSGEWAHSARAHAQDAARGAREAAAHARHELLRAQEQLRHAQERARHAEEQARHAAEAASRARDDAAAQP